MSTAPRFCVRTSTRIVATGFTTYLAFRTGLVWGVTTGGFAWGGWGRNRSRWGTRAVSSFLHRERMYHIAFVGHKFCRQRTRILVELMSCESSCFRVPNRFVRVSTVLKLRMPQCFHVHVFEPFVFEIFECAIVRENITLFFSCDGDVIGILILYASNS